MATYIVRVRKNMALVGICSASNRVELLLQVDEITDPFGCEFMTMPNGCGVFFDGEFRKELDDFVDEEDEDYKPEDPNNYTEALYPHPKSKVDEPVKLSDSMHNRLQRAAWAQFTLAEFCEAFDATPENLKKPGAKEWLEAHGIVIPELS